MTDFTIIDSHVHFWDPAALRYPWLEQLPLLERAYLPLDYTMVDTGDVTGMVFVEANCTPTESAREVTFVERLSAVEPRIMGTVAFVDLLDERVRARTLDRLAELPRVVGVRHNIQGNGPGFCTAAAFVRGVRDVGARGLTFDVCVTEGQLSDVVELLEECPDTQCVLDHCGKPAIRDGSFDVWGDDLRQVSACPNVSCKLSGLLTEAHAEQRDYESLVRYAQHALECFGASRLLYGSDWPLVTLAGGLAAWRRITDRFTALWTPGDRQRFYADNAIRLYGLELHAHP